MSRQGISPHRSHQPERLLEVLVAPVQTAPTAYRIGPAELAIGVHEENALTESGLDSCNRPAQSRNRRRSPQIHASCVAEAYSERFRDFHRIQKTRVRIGVFTDQAIDVAGRQSRVLDGRVGCLE